MATPTKPPVNLSDVWAFSRICDGPYTLLCASTPEIREEQQQNLKSEGLAYTTNTQCAGTCDHCGTAIGVAYWLKGSSGEKFKVGSSCVEKSTLPKATIDRVKKHKNKRSANIRREKQRLQAQLNKATVIRNRALLSGLPHPKFSGSSLYEYLKYMCSVCGNAKFNKLMKKQIADHDLVVPTHTPKMCDFPK